MGGSCNALALFGSSGFELTLKSAPSLPCLAGESIAAARHPFKPYRSIRRIFGWTT